MSSKNAGKVKWVVVLGSESKNTTMENSTPNYQKVCRFFDPISWTFDIGKPTFFTSKSAAEEQAKTCHSEIQGWHYHAVKWNPHRTSNGKV